MKADEAAAECVERSSASLAKIAICGWATRFGTRTSSRLLSYRDLGIGGSRSNRLNKPRGTLRKPVAHNQKIDP